MLTLSTLSRPALGALKNSAVVTLALLTGLIYFYPTASYWYIHHSTAYFPITSYDEDYYAALAATVASGKGLGDHPFLADQGGAHGMANETLLFLPRLGAGGLVRLLGLGRAFGAMSLIVPCLVFFLIYRVVEDISGNTWWSLAGACGVLLLGYYLPPLSGLAKSFGHLSSWRIGLASLLQGNLSYGRRYNPALSAIPFYAFLLLHWKVASEPRRGWAILCGIVGGLLFYAYYFFAVGAFMISVVWAIACAWAHRDRFSAAMTTLLAQAILAVPFLALTLYNLRLYQAGFSQRMHSPWFPTTDILAAALPVLALRVFRGPSLQFSWLAAVATGPIFAMNTQVVTGIRVEPWHFDTYLVVPLSILSLSTVCGILLGSREWPRAGMVAVGFIAACLWAGATTAKGALRSANEFARDPMEVDALVRAIKANTASTDVLLIGDNVASAQWMVAAAGRPVFVAFYVASFPSKTPGEYRLRGDCYYWLNGYTEAQFMGGPANNARSYVYAPEGFRYWFYPNLLTDEVKKLRTQEFDGCLSNPQGCCAPEFRADWLVESVNSPFDRNRLSQLYQVSPAENVGEFRISRLQRNRQ